MSVFETLGDVGSVTQELVSKATTDLDVYATAKPTACPSLHRHYGDVELHLLLARRCYRSF